MITAQDKKSYHFRRYCWNDSPVKAVTHTDAAHDPQVAVALAQIAMGEAYLDSLMKLTVTESRLR